MLQNILPLLALSLAFSLACDRILDPGESIYIDTEGRGPAGIDVSPTSGLFTSENRDTAQFQVVLKSQPESDVYIPVIAQNPREGRILPSPGSRDQIMLIFTPANWNTPQPVVIIGVDEYDWPVNPYPEQDGDIPYIIELREAFSEDSRYNGIKPSNVLLTNYDNDYPGIIIEGNPDVFFTNENGGHCNIRIKLRMKPDYDVTIGPIVSSDDTEGVVTYPPAPGNTITISSYSWDMSTSITVTGQPDDGDATSQTYTVDFGTFASADPAWNGLAAGSVTLVNHKYRPITDYVLASGSESFQSISGMAGAQRIVFQQAYYMGYNPQSNGIFTINMGFSFNYLGMATTRIIATTDGMASFSPAIYEYSNFADNYALFSNWGLRYVLAPWWDDLTMAFNNAYYITTGSAPNRVFIIEWNDAVNEYNNVEKYTFQIRLYEGSNMIRFAYGEKKDGPGSSASSASIGINDDYAGYIDAGTGYTMTYDEFPPADTVIDFILP
jgi:hypothetical protein